MRKAITFLIIAVFTSPALSDVAVDFVPIDNSVAPELNGFVTQDIKVLTTFDWTASGMVLDLTSGSIYQDPSGGEFGQPPSPVVLLSDPVTRFDTYVGIIDDGFANIAGTAGGLGGTSAGWPFQFDTEALDVTWFNLPQTDNGVSTVGRLSLSDDAQGTLAFSVSEQNKQFVQYEFPIVDGHVIPDSIPNGNILCGGCHIGVDALNDVLINWNQNVPPADPNADFNRDGFIGVDDLNVVLGFWNLDTLRPTESLQLVSFPGSGDGFVGVDDLNIVLLNWNQTVSPGDPLVGDFDGDGFIGQDDLNAILTNWNNGTPPLLEGDLATVPEPVTMALWIVAAPWLLCRRVI